MLGVHAGARNGDAALGGAGQPVDASVRGNATANANREMRKEPMTERQHRTVDRRTFLKGSLATGGLLAGAGAAIAALADADQAAPTPVPVAPPPVLPPAPTHTERPNILVIVVDQLRFPQWYSAQRGGLALTPNLQRLSGESVSLARHYTASNDCTPARSTLLTGLYTQQTGCMITGGSTLDPGFPTWGTMLREHGYHTWWYGKWHLTHRDHHWTQSTGGQALERYGFSGGTFPSPDGAPGQGWRRDPQITHQFVEWLRHEGGREPWCTTVSLVNPHDIAWWYTWSDRVPPEASAESVVHRLPPNFETPQQLAERGKPRLQRSFQETTAASFGAVPFSGPGVTREWLKFINLYAKLQRRVDHDIGRILGALDARPEIASNTVILFTSDHGEYGGSHGLRGKGAGAYEEAIRVPLLVKDPRGRFATSPDVVRNQLTSSVDIAPLLLTIATGTNDWRREAQYSHLADRLDLARILRDPAAPGRSHVLHTTDEVVTEYAIEPYAADAPLHVVALRTPRAKYAVYSDWAPGGTSLVGGGEDRELYDYGTHGGRLEVENVAGHSELEEQLNEQLDRAYGQELRATLPGHLRAAQDRGFGDYLQTATGAARAAAERRKVHTERKHRESHLHAHRHKHPPGRSAAPIKRP